MSYKIKSLAKFEKNLKKLVQKYHSLKIEYVELIQSLKEHPDQGISIGQNCYKIRLSIASKGKGKSGGARVITYCYIAGETVYLLTIYDKSEKENLSDEELKKLLSQISE